MERHLSADMPLEQIDTYMDMFPLVSKYIDLRYAHVDASGQENIPEGPVMFVANHLRRDDSLIIAKEYVDYMEKPLRFGAKSEYFDGKGLFGKTIQRFMEDTQEIPVYREDNRKGAVSLAKDIKDRFSLGESVLLHAEGTRSKDGRLNKFRLGAAAFAIKDGVPLLPVSITYDNRHFYQRTIARLQFGEPLMPQDYGIEFRHYQHIPDGLIDAIASRAMKKSDRIAAVTDIAEQRVAHMSGQERSGVYLNPYESKTT